MVFSQLQKWPSFGLIFMKLGLPEKLGTLKIVIVIKMTVVTEVVIMTSFSKNTLTP